MPKVKDLIQTLKSQYKPDDEIAYSIWSVDDVLEEAESMGVKMKKKTAKEIVANIHDHQDSESGINWSCVQNEINEFVERQEQ